MTLPSIRTNRTATLLLSALVVVAAMTTGALAVGLDNSTSDATPTMSDVLGGDTIVLNATTNDTHTIEAIVGNSTTPAVKVTANNTLYAENTTMAEGAVGSEGTHWTGNISEQPLLDVPIPAGGNVSVNLVVYNTSNTTEEFVNTTIYLTNEGGYATLEEGTVTAQSDDGRFSGILSSSSDPTPAETEQTVAVTSNTSTIRFVPQNSTMQSSIGDQVTSHDSSAALWTVQMKVDGSYVPVVSEGQTLPDWIGKNDTHGVAQSDGTVVVKNANFTSAKDVTVKAVGSDKLGFWEQSSLMQDYGVNQVNALWKASGDYNGNPSDLEFAS